VQRLESEMIKLKGKTLGKPTQDNHDHMVNKLELGTTITRSYSQQKYKYPHHKKQEKVKDLKHIKSLSAPIWVTMPSCALPKLRARQDTEEGKEDN
jgi:hypothetical protein